jgi:outer membrane murein-binding lipoprotein Lpp
MPGKHGLRALLALAAAGVALSGCGSDEVNGEIPAENADALSAALAELREATEQTPPDCSAARFQADELVRYVNDLPATAEEAKDELQSAAPHLQALVDAECPNTGTSGSPTTTPTTTSETTDTTSTDTTQTTNTDTTSTDTTTTETDTTTTQTQPSGNGNGAGTGGTSGGTSDDKDD